MTLRVPVGPEPVLGVRVVDAREQAARIATQEAFQAGLAQGRTEAREQEAGALTQATEQLLHATAKAAAEIAIEVARELLLVEVQAGHHNIEGMVREVLAASAVGRAQCIIHLNPADVDALADTHFRSGTTLEKDTGVARGDVHVETELGLMVREIDTVLDSFRERLRENLQ